MNTCDFPPVSLEKAMWAKLSEDEPSVAMLMQRFFLEERVTKEIERMMENEKLGIVSAVCKWMKAEGTRPVWEAWLPPERYRVECELGQIVVGKSCSACPPGTFSSKLYATECSPCTPGETLCSSVTVHIVECLIASRGAFGTISTTKVGSHASRCAIGASAKPTQSCKAHGPVYTS